MQEKLDNIIQILDFVPPTYSVLQENTLKHLSTLLINLMIFFLPTHLFGLHVYSELWSTTLPSDQKWIIQGVDFRKI